MAKVVVLGLGYVGLTTALGLANLGHSVVGVDTDTKKLAALSQGKVPFFEEGVEELLNQLVESSRISFRDAIENGTKEKTFYFLCVPTPIDSASETDMSYFDSAVNSVVTHAAPDSVLVIKSTVPIGTASSLRGRIVSKGIEVANNPEFLKEGTALRDFEKPNRIVVGATNPNTSSEVLDLYEKVVAPKLATSLNSAETIKYASNAYLALRISFVNELATASELIDADLEEVLEGVSLDERIGKLFMSPGPGWGGSCFPKDTKEYLNSLSRFEFSPATVASAVESNRLHQMRIVDRARNLLGGSFSKKKVAIWGLAFKANTDDVRDSPSLAIARSILAEGATIAAYDPMVTEVSIPGLEVVRSAQEASAGADLIMVMTEWNEFKHLSPAEIRATVSEGKIFDTRRIINRESWKKHFGTVAILGGS
jgi:UDPglucose 6-dehydrogenase